FFILIKVYAARCTGHSKHLLDDIYQETPSGASEKTNQRLTFRELEALTSFLTPSFLTLYHTRVTSKETFLLQNRAVFSIVFYQSPSDSHSCCLRLPFDTSPF